MNVRIVLSALAGVLFLSTAALAQPRPDPAASDVARAVSTYGRYTVFDDVRADVDGGTVTLSGKVTAPLKKEEIGRRVAALNGVTSVRNDIEVLPALASDDDLRHRVARAIYGNSAFWRYAAMPTPPIRILVDRGRVTLTGVVASESDRILARSLASGHGEITLTCDLRTDR